MIFVLSRAIFPIGYSLLAVSYWLSCLLLTWPCPGSLETPMSMLSEPWQWAAKQQQQQQQPKKGLIAILPPRDQ